MIFNDLHLPLPLYVSKRCLPSHCLLYYILPQEGSNLVIKYVPFIIFLCITEKWHARILFFRLTIVLVKQEFNLNITSATFKLRPSYLSARAFATQGAISLHFTNYKFLPDIPNLA